MLPTPSIVDDFVLGFHGTDAEVVEEILNGRDHLEPSPRGYDWFGDGIYFWEDDPRRALWWAERTRAESIRGNKEHRLPVKIEKPAVIGAIIYLGRSFNLCFDESQRLVADVHAQIEKRYRKNRWKLPTNDFYYRSLDCLVINETCRAIGRVAGARVDTVRGVAVGCIDSDPQLGPSPAYPGSLLLAETYKIVAVRTRKVIVDYFEVRFDE